MLRIVGAGHAPGARTNGRAEGGLRMPEQRSSEFGAHTEPRVSEGVTAVGAGVSPSPVSSAGAAGKCGLHGVTGEGIYCSRYSAPRTGSCETSHVQHYGLHNV